MTQWQDDKRWSDRFIPAIKPILGTYLIGPAPQEDDAERNTDLVVLRMDSVRIACRIRKHEYHLKYAGEFTIRFGRPSGIKTELTKIIEGWGDYFFYGFASSDERGLVAWTLCDLKVFRLWFNRSIAGNKGLLPGIVKDNHDLSSSFRVFRYDELPSDFIVGTSSVSTTAEAVA